MAKSASTFVLLSIQLTFFFLNFPTSQDIFPPFVFFFCLPLKTIFMEFYLYTVLSGPL